eukprot:m.38433 g.38433  ORF g.38433 m.38433 type:complete len:116 (-) comp11484_c0_seq1:192-539(-)
MGYAFIDLLFEKRDETTTKRYIPNNKSLFSPKAKLAIPSQSAANCSGLRTAVLSTAMSPTSSEPAVQALLTQEQIVSIMCALIEPHSTASHRCTAPSVAWISLFRWTPTAIYVVR